MPNINFLNEDCFKTMQDMQNDGLKMDVILTSPPYNISRGVLTNEELTKHKSKYKDFKDNIPNDEYRTFLKNVFIEYDKILSENGVVLLNLSYGSCVDCKSNSGDLIRTIYKIIDETPFELADIITWKKRNAIPNNRSGNKLTRITEYIFVLCRKNEYSSFSSNKKLTSFNEEKNLKFYENITNFIEAKNNDGPNDLNKATFSTDLVKQLLNIYAKPNSKIYDSFMGTGTTGIACNELGFDCWGSEISLEQVEYSKKLLEKSLITL